MHRPTHADVLELAVFAGEPCVSLYLATRRVATDPGENPAQLRRLLRLAAARLAESGASPEACAQILEPVRQWLADADNWHHPGDGLAVFAAPGLFRVFALEFSPREDVSVESRFRLRPLLGLLEERERFYVLALSAHHTRVLEVTLHGGCLAARRLAPPHLPANLTEALGPTVYSTDLQMHTASSAALGSRRGFVHGQGDRDQAHYQSDLLAYFRVVARALREALPDREAPLVLAAVEEYLPLYRTASRDPRLLDRVVAGNPELDGDAALAERALEIAEPRLAHRRRRDLRRLADLAGSPRVARQLAEITRAAEQGRVESLFLTPEAEHWGIVNPATGEARLHSRRRTGDLDLVERAALAAAMRGAAVHVMPTPEMPGPGDMVAVLRY
jgi:hypothetical protein